MVKNKYRELSKNSFWTFLGNVGGKIIAFLMLPFYTSILSVADYGILDMVTGYTVTMCDVITLCITQAIFVFPKNVSQENQMYFFTSGLAFSFVIAVLFGFAAKLLAELLLSPNNVFRYNFYYIYAMSIASFLQSYLQNFIRSIDKMKVYGFIGLIYALTTAIYSLILMPYWGIYGYAISIIMANLTVSIYTFKVANLKKYFNLKAVKWSKYKTMLVYSAPLVVNVIISFVTQFLNRPFMEHYQTLENVGLYSVASKFPSIIGVMVPVFCLALQISVMDEFGKEGYCRFYNNILRLTSVILICGSIILVPMGKYLIYIFAAQEYADAWKYMPVLLLSTIFNFWGYFFGTNFTAVKKSKYFLYTGVATMIVSVFANYFFIPHYGLIGVCLATLITGMSFCIARLAYSWQYVRVSNLYKYIMEILGLIIVSVVCVYFDFDALSISFGLFMAALLIFMNRNLLPLFWSQIKRK